jgi:hypothetical protein
MFVKYKLQIALFVSMYSCITASAQRIVKVNTESNNPNEVSIAINPLNPAQVVAGSNIYNLYFSTDSGFSWTEKILKSSMGVYGDPVVHFMPNGACLFAHLAMNKDRSKKDGSYSGLDRMVIQRSIDGGRTFNDGSYCGLNTPKMQDKPWLSHDATGNIYVSWTEFDKYGSAAPNDKSRIRFAQSNDSGFTFTQAITVSDNEGDCLDKDNTPEGATTAVGPHGEIYIAWAAFGKLYMDKSMDGGRSFGTDHEVTWQRGGWDLDIEGMYRGNGLPFLKCDKKGNLYLLYAEEIDAPSIPSDRREKIVSVIISKDGGASWGKPQVLNRSNAMDGFMPNMCHDELMDKIYIAWYDRRHSQNKKFADIYVAAMAENADSFVGRRITPISFPLPFKYVFFGDYIGIDAAKDMVRPIWTEDDTDGLVVKCGLLNASDLQKDFAAPNTEAYRYKTDLQHKVIYIHEQASKSSREYTWYWYHAKKGKWKKVERSVTNAYDDQQKPLLEVEHELTIREMHKWGGRLKKVYKDKSEKMYIIESWEILSGVK